MNRVFRMWCRQWSFRLCYLLPVTCYLLLSAAALQAKPETPQMVTAEALVSKSALPAGSSFRLAVVLDVKDGYHINGAVPDALWPSKLEVKSSSNIDFDAPQYPEPLLKTFEFTAGEKIPVYEGTITVFVDGQVAAGAAPGEGEIEAVFSYQGCDESQCFAPTSVSVTIPAKVVAKNEPATDIHPEIFGQGNPTDGRGSPFKRGLLLGFLALFGIGFLLSFTPCVYPMIPVTIGYFGMQTERRTGKLVLLAALYIAGLAITYSVLGVVAALTGGIFGAALQNPYVPLVIAAVLVALALSMFGLYEIRPPAFIAAKSQDKRGPVGALLMGLLFGIVAAPCVGPVTIGMLLPVAKSGNPALGFFTFFAFALGMGTPMFFLAMFSGSINRLPRAGMWMVTVKKVFGLLLLGTAIYYVTPLVRTHVSESYAPRLLPLFIMVSGLYIGWLEGSLRKLPRLKHVRKGAGLALVALGLALLNPTQTKLQPMTFEPYSDAAVARAAVEGKPVMIDFYADWCAACRELEHLTFTDPKVQKEAEQFVRLRSDHTKSSPELKSRLRKYDVQGLPAVVFLDGSGKDVKDARVIGFLKPDEFLKRIGMVGAR